LIDNLEFEDSDSKEKEEKSETKKDDSSSDNNNEENNLTDVEEEKARSDAEFSVIDSSVDSINKDDDLNQNEAKEVRGDPSLQKSYQKNLLKDKYKIFTTEYDEVKEANNKENEDEINGHNWRQSYNKKDFEKRSFTNTAIVDKISTKDPSWANNETKTKTSELLIFDNNNNKNTSLSEAFNSKNITAMLDNRRKN
jgi:cobalamin biosynthesis protein CobT